MSLGSCPTKSRLYFPAYIRLIGVGVKRLTVLCSIALTACVGKAKFASFSTTSSSGGGGDSNSSVTITTPIREATVCSVLTARLVAASSEHGQIRQ